ncbi:MAG: hypothetical protein IKY53_01865, partial [Lachnospiraceae bacterium]|nr:hypothetical protein [Lachnospiraceae bacterium]
SEEVTEEAVSEETTEGASEEVTEETVSEETTEEASEEVTEEAVSEEGSETVAAVEENALPYIGEIFENEDGNILTISGDEMVRVGMDFTIENLQKILDAQTLNFLIINFCCYDSEMFTVVPKELWNKAVSIMDEKYYSRLNFDWHNATWYAYEPQVTEEDITLTLNNSFSEADNGISISFAQTAIPGSACIELYYSKSHPDYAQISSFADESTEYGLYDGKEKISDVTLYAYDDDYAFCFDYSDLFKGKNYTIKAVPGNEEGLPAGIEMGPFNEDGKYIGYASVQDDGYSALTLDSNMIDVDSFNADVCEDIVSYWSSQGIKFDRIFITQNAAGGYVIKKDIYEMLRTRLLSDKALQINFQFNNLIEPAEYDEDVVIKEKNETILVWGFGKPKALESDINAAVSIALNENKETILTFADKRKFDEDIFVLVSATKNNDLNKNVFAPGLGDAADFLGDVSKQSLYVVGNGILNYPLGNVRYYTYDNCVDIIIDQMSRINTSAENVLYNPSEIDKGLLDTVNGLVLEAEAGATDVAFYGVDGEYNLEHFTEDWVLYALTENSTVTMLCTYLNAAGESVAQLWNYNTVHGATKFKFTYPEIELEWDGTDNGDVHFLEVAYLPATENIWPDTCTWEVVSGNGIEFLPDYYYANGWGSKYPYKITGFGETVVKASYAGASTTCVIRVLPKVKVPAIPTIYAAPQVNGTLADIDLNAIVKGAEGTFAWKDASVKLADYAGSDSMQAEALYTVKGRKPVSVWVRVDLVWITGVEIGAYDKTQASGQYYVALPDSIKKDEEIVLCAELLINNSSKEAVDLLKQYVKAGKLSVKWTDKEKGELLAEDLVSESAIFAPRSYTAIANGKKTLQVSVMSANSKKALAIKKANLVVTANDVFSFAPEVFTLTDANPTEMKGMLTVKVASENYKVAKKLTVKSEDTSVLKLGKAQTEVK